MRKYDMRQMTKIPISAWFSFSYRVYDAITTYAYQHNKGICQAMQDFIEFGLYAYFPYDPALKQRFDALEQPAPSPTPPTCNHPVHGCDYSPPPFSAPGLPACPVTGAENEPPTSTKENDYDLDPAH